MTQQVFGACMIEAYIWADSKGLWCKLEAAVPGNQLYKGLLLIEAYLWLLLLISIKVTEKHFASEFKKDHCVICKLDFENNESFCVTKKGMLTIVNCCEKHGKDDLYTYV